MRVIGLDPGLRRTGWGVIETQGNCLRHIGHGVVAPDPGGGLAERLVALHQGLLRILAEFGPDEAAVEVSLANRNATATVKLGMARGVALLTPALGGIPATEYLPSVVKQAVVGTGQAAKSQVASMVARLLPGCAVGSADAADALAVAICHANTAATTRRWPAVTQPARPAPGAAR